MGLGTCPELSLANARKKSGESARAAAQGIDPKVQRNAQDEAERAETEHTFESVATAWFELMEESLTPRTPKTFGDRSRCMYFQT